MMQGIYNVHNATILNNHMMILNFNMSKWTVFVFQIKKLVYVYLMRYAEEQQDLALLSISTFQRALKVSKIKLKVIFFIKYTILFLS